MSMKLTNNERMHIISDEITTPNYRSWLRGCPRKSEEEIAALEEAHKRVEAARQALMKEIEQQKGE